VAAAAEDSTATRADADKATLLEEDRLRPRPASEHGSQQLSILVGEGVSAPATAPVQVNLPEPVELEVQPAAQGPAPVLRTEAVASPAPVSVVVPVEAPVSASTCRATRQTPDFAPVSSQPLVIEGGLAPITEALIKILVLKARQGALSEDKAFELLGAVRLL
jgi:hypothetical protein